MKQDVLNGSMTIERGQARSWNITIDPNHMSNAEVNGQVSSMGGADGKITLMLAYQGRAVFSCRESLCEIHQTISSPGVYTLILDNRISPILPVRSRGRSALNSSSSRHGTSHRAPHAWMLTASFANARTRPSGYQDCQSAQLHHRAVAPKELTNLAQS